MRFLEWWRLPGPAALLDSVLDSMRAGNCAVLGVPSHGVPCIEEGLVNRSPEVFWEDSDTLLSSMDGDGRGLATRIADSVDQQARWYWWVISDPLVGHSALDFLGSYRQLAQGFPVHLRTRFCLIFRGEAALGLPASETGLSVFRWQGAVGEFDTLLFVAHRLAPCRSLEDRLRASVVSRIAQGDLDLAGGLVEQPMEVVMQPGKWLRDVAWSRGWDGPSAKMDEHAWAEGRALSTTAGETEHSASLAARGRDSVVARLVWGGQVAVLMPLVEEGRRRVVRRLKGLLRPTTDEDGIVTQPSDLEIGQVWFQMKRGKGLGLSQSQQDVVEHLRRVRNDLAHLECVPADSVGDEGRYLIDLIEDA